MRKLLALGFVGVLLAGSWTAVKLEVDSIIVDDLPPIEGKYLFTVPERVPAILLTQDGLWRTDPVFDWRAHYLQQIKQLEEQEVGLK